MQCKLSASYIMVGTEILSFITVRDKVICIKYCCMKYSINVHIEGKLSIQQI